MRRHPFLILVSVVVGALLAASAVLCAVKVTAGTGRPPAITLTVNELSAPWATDYESRATRVKVNSTASEQLTVRIWHDGRNILTYRNVDDGEELELRIAREYAQGRWYATASARGHKASVSIPVAQNWSLLSSRDSLPAPCSTVSWFFETEGSAKDSDTLRQEIQAILDNISRSSGLTFVQVFRADAADLTYSWESLGSFGNPGVGGFQTSDARTYRGWVTINANAVAHDRSTIILHETAHALGLGHVTDPAQVMHPRPTSEGLSELGTGDRAGLAWLYHPDTCDAPELGPTSK